MRFRFFKSSRDWHKWTGYLCAIFFLFLAVSGILLMHRDSLELDQVEISARYLPEKYFKMVGEGLQVQTVALLPEHPSTLFVGTQNGLYRSRNGGETWVALHEGLRNQDVRAIVISPVHPEIVYAATARGIFMSENGGDLWTEWFEESAGLRYVNVRDLILHPDNPETLFAATDGGVFKSEDEGDIWQSIFENSSHPEGKDVRFIRFSSRRQSLYIGTAAGVYKSEDDGETWSLKWEGVLPASAQDIASLDTEPEFIYTGSKKGLHKSFNRGITWVKDPTLNSISVRKIFINPFQTTLVYAATESGMQVSEDGGDTWEKLAVGGEKNLELEFAWMIFPAAGREPFMFVATHSAFWISWDGGMHWERNGLTDVLDEKAGGHLKMDLVKLLTEIHTGRFFGDVVFFLLDVATVGLLFLVVSGVAISVYRNRIAQSNTLKERLRREELPVDAILEIQETADDLSSEGHQIHDMIEHINSHLARCKTIYLSREKQEIAKIGAHIDDIDKKMQHLMERIEEFDKLSQTDEAR